MSEIWKEIPGHWGYEASSAGRVRSVDRTIEVRGQSDRRLRGRVLKQSLTHLGYYFVNLGVVGGSVPVHACICMAFHGPRPDQHVVRHLDGVYTNNEASNLTWGTQVQNQADSLRHNTQWERRKTHCPAGHEYAPPNLYISQNPRGGFRRHCRACRKK